MWIERNRGGIMDWIEVVPLPEACQKCMDEDCYNCDMAGQRWVLSEQAQLQIKHNGICKQLERLLVELSEVDRELERFS